MQTIVVMNQLDKFAAADLRRAQKEGLIYITDTKLGTLELTYNRYRIYTLRTMTLNPKTLASGKPAVVRPVLAAAYDLRVES